VTEDDAIMTNPHDPPAVPDPAAAELGPAGSHRAASEQAAGRQDYDAAVRERFRAVVRGLEQTGVLDVERSRTARRSAIEAGAQLPGDADGLGAGADVFDAVVYGGRAATPDEYRQLEQLDRFSLSAPPPRTAREVAEVEPTARRCRRVPDLPALLRNPRFWLLLLALLALITFLLYLPTSCSVSPPHPPGGTSAPSSDGGGFSDNGPPRKSIFQVLPPRLAFGGLQLLIAGAVVVVWRSRRRGALVPEPRPAEVAANELTAGRAQLYRRTRDRNFVAAKLRNATLRRIRTGVGLTFRETPDRTVAMIVARTGHPEVVTRALYGLVPDDATLIRVAGELDWIEAEVGTQ
jgi:hypothetical protein